MSYLGSVPCAEVTFPSDMIVVDKEVLCYDAATSSVASACRLSATLDNCVEVVEPEALLHPDDLMDLVVDTQLEVHDALAATCENPNKFVHKGKEVCWDAWWHATFGTGNCGLTQKVKDNCDKNSKSANCVWGLHECQTACLDSKDGCNAITVGNNNSSKGECWLWPKKCVAGHTYPGWGTEFNWQQWLHKDKDYSAYIKATCTNDHDKWSIFHNTYVRNRTCSYQPEVDTGKKTSVKECRDLCTKATNCKGISYGKMSGVAGKCWLIQGCGFNSELTSDHVKSTHKYDVHFRHATGQVDQMKHVICQ